MKGLHIVSGIVCLFAALFGAVMLSFPHIDLLISAHFFDRESQQFFLARDPFFLFVHNSTSYIVVLSALLYGFFAYRAYKEKPVLGITLKQAIFLFLVLIIGPGLVANTLLKDNWGRARPSQIEQFGGDKQFSPPLIMADQCERNCSFVSGDPSVGFHFFGIALLFFSSAPWLVLLPLLSGALFGFTRIVQGAHFFSDVVFAGIFVYLVSYVLYLILRRFEE